MTKRVTCARVHEWTPENTYTRPNGERECRTCKDIKFAEWIAAHPRTGVRTPTVPRQRRAPRPIKTCVACRASLERGDVCDQCAVCRCGSGRPPGLCHGTSKSGLRVAVCR